MTEQPILLTPGPLTTTAATKEAMLIDWGSWDDDFRALTAKVRARLLTIAKGSRAHTVIPVQGSGTFAVEAALNSFVPRNGKILVLTNGAYGERMVRTVETMGRAYAFLAVRETAAVHPAQVESALLDDPDITHVGLIHCETGTGLLNPLEEIAAVVREQGRRLIVDAMSTFGALPIDIGVLPADAVIASANKCLEGVPGFGFVVSPIDAVERAAGNCTSLSLDLADQWTYMERTGQWRFTPPTHVVAAFDRALDQHEAEGGVPARGARYAANCAALVNGMRALGFQTLLADDLQAPIIVTFLEPADPAYDFKAFYAALKRRGFIIYPGKTTEVASFRMGCIGAITADDMARLIDAVAEAMRELGIASPAPAATEVPA